LAKNPETEEETLTYLSTMYQKQKGLAMNGRNLLKVYLIEPKCFSIFLLAKPK